MKAIIKIQLIFIVIILILKKGECQTYPANPDVIVSCFVGGPLSEPFVGNSAAVISDPYNTRVTVTAFTMPTHDKVWATGSQVGSVYGIAYSPSTGKAYTSAFVKRHTQLGPGNGGNPSGFGSAGAIYVMDPPPSGGGPAGVNVLLDIGAAAGTTVRTPSSDWTCDPVMYEVGRVGWGDIDVSLDGTVLWAMNLFNKSLYKININTGAILGTYPIPGVMGGLPFDAPLTNNENLDLRPFGLKVTQDKVYVGVISSGESLYPPGGVGYASCNGGAGFPALRGYVFEFEVGSSAFNNVPVLDFGFEGASWNNGDCNDATGGKWVYWAPLAIMEAEYGSWPNRLRNPAIADTEIDDDGNMLIGLRNMTHDRLSTIPGLFYPDCTNGSDVVFGGFGGQVLIACGGGSSWTIESGGSCGGSGGFNSEVYYDYEQTHSNGDYGGAIAYKTGTGEFLLPGSPGSDQGSMLFVSETAKTFTEENTIYSLRAFPVDPDFNPLFGKANGLGDVDLLTEPSVQPTCSVSVSANPSVCEPSTNSYNVTGEITFSNAPTTGTLTVSIGSMQQTFTAPFMSPQLYTLMGLPSDGMIHTVNVVFSADNTCMGTEDYTAPVSCSNVLCTMNLEYLWCPGESYTLTAEPGLTGYQWYKDGVIIAGATSQVYIANMLGIYTWTATDGMGCPSMECCPIELIEGNCCSLAVNCNPQPQTSCTPVNGSASVAVTGGQGNITYLWSSGETTSSISGKGAGTYTVTVTDDGFPGCTATCEAIVASTTTLPTATCTPMNNTNCATPNGSVSVATNANQISWSTGATTAMITGLSAGTYTVTVTNTTTGCTNTCQAVVGTTTVDPTCTITVNSQPSCANLTGGSITVNPNPAGTYSYNWSDIGSGSANKTGLSGGTYTVTVTNTTTGCTGVCQTTLDTPMNCCEITTISIVETECLDNNTPSNMTDNRLRVGIMAFNLNTSLTTYNVSVNGGTTISPTSGTYGVPTYYTLGPGTGGSGATFRITLTDSGTPGCTNFVDVVSPENCLPGDPPCPVIQCGTATIQVNNN